MYKPEVTTMTDKELDKKLTEHGWYWSCWESLWRKDEKTIEYTELSDVVILKENGKTTEYTKHDICKMLNIDE